MKRAIIPLALTFIGCLVAAAIVWPDHRYVSTAVLGEAANPPFDDGKSTGSQRIVNLSQAVLSRGAIIAMIAKLNLYPEESHTIPLEDIVEKCRLEEIHISPLKLGGVDHNQEKPVNFRAFALSFRHNDPHLAQSAAQYLASRFLEANVRLGEAIANAEIAFLDDESEAAASDWAAKEKAPHGNLPADERRIATLDAELARSHYLHLRAKAASAAIKRSAGQIGPRLEQIDSASLPSAPEFPWWPALRWGAGTGFALGMLVLAIPFLRRVTLRQGVVAFAFGAVCLITADILLNLPACQSYTSKAVLAVTPGTVQQSLVPADPQAVKEFLTAIRGNAVSRVNLANIIHTYRLYPRILRRMPMEEIVGRMRNDIGIGPETSDSGAFAISFQYNESRYLAQKVAQDIASRMMEGFLRLQTLQTQGTIEFLRGDCDLAAKEWTRAVHAAGPNPDRLALDIELARKRYIALKEKAANAAVAASVISQRQGPHLEMLDPARLPPETGDFDNAILAASSLLGVIAGLIWKRPR